MADKSLYRKGDDPLNSVTLTEAFLQGEEYEEAKNEIEFFNLIDILYSDIFDKIPDFYKDFVKDKQYFLYKINLTRSKDGLERKYPLSGGGFGFGGYGGGEMS